MRNTTKLQQIEGGRQVKQSDNSSKFAFILKDANGRDIDLNGETAQIVLYTLDSKLYWQTETTIKKSTVEFTLPGNLVDRDYVLEISAGGYVFPSDENLIIRVNKGFAEYVGLIEAYALRKATREIIKEEAQNVTANIAKELDYSKLKGEPFRYEDFTTEQLESLKGEKGDAFTYDDFTPEQLEKLKGEKGEPFTYDDFSEEQLARLVGEKGEPGESIEVKETGTDDEGNILVTFTDDTQITIPKGAKGDKGDALKYEDLTEDQKEELKGKDGTMSFEDLTEDQRATLKGEQGASITITETSEDELGNIVIKFSDNTEVTIPRGKNLTYEDLTEEQKAELKGKQGDRGEPGKDGSDANVIAGKGLTKSGDTISVDNTVAFKSDLTGFAKSADIPKMVSLTQEDYDKLSNKDPNTFYFIIGG